MNVRELKDNDGKVFSHSLSFLDCDAAFHLGVDDLSLGLLA